LIQAAKAERVCSVISNCTGLEVFFVSQLRVRRCGHRGRYHELAT
jgi:hypothetical protein